MAERVTGMLAAFQRSSANLRAQMQRIAFFSCRAALVCALMNAATLRFLANLFTLEDFMLFIQFEAFNLSPLSAANANLLHRLKTLAT